MTLPDDQRLAQLESKVEAVHEDLHSMWTAIEELRRRLINRPSWAVVFYLTFMSALAMALGTALLQQLVQ